ncbi:MAG: energy-coupling factor transporter transmembrane component T family protein, partial [Methanosarcinaceae archaeon]
AMPDMMFSYVQGTSFIHRLDPRTKIIAVMVLSIFIFRSTTVVHLCGMALLFLILCHAGRVGVLHHLRSLRPMLVFFTFIFMVQLFLTSGTPLFTFGWLQPTVEGMVKGALVTSRFILLILYASMLTSTTRAAMLTNGIERLLRPLPLKGLGVTSFEIATMMSLSIHFVPVLLMHARDVRNAQFSRGLGNRRNFYTGMMSMVIPVLTGSLRMADEIAMGMDSRCYQGRYRTSLFELRMRTADRLVIGGISILFGFIVLSAL